MRPGSRAFDNRIRGDARKVVAAMAVELRARGYTTRFVPRRRGASFWGPGDRSGFVALLPYVFPDARAPDRPLIYRFSVDLYGAAARARLCGTDASSAPESVVMSVSLELELSVLPEELIAFGRFLPAWIEWRLGGGSRPEPPHEVSWWPDENYAWSCAALAVFDEWTRRRIGR